MGSTGLGSETYLAPTLLNHIAGTKFKVVKGYNGGAKINKAMEGGEVHGRMNYWSGWTAGKPAWVANNKLNHLASYGGDIAALPNIPKLINLAKSAEEKAMVRFLEVAPRIGMGFWVHPEVPKGRVAALRKAFMAMLSDPKFLADAKKRNAPLNPVAGATLNKLVAEAYATPKPAIAKLKIVLGFK